MMSNFAEQTKFLRKKLNFSMQVLADRAGVCKSTISKIEKSEMQPTLDVATRIAKALNTNLSRMLHTHEDIRIALFEASKQAIWTDPVTGLERREVAPPFVHNKLEWLHLKVPAKANIAKFPSFGPESEKCIYVMKGELEITIGVKAYHLKAGDSIYFEANVEHEQKNIGSDTLEYFAMIVLA